MHLRLMGSCLSVEGKATTVEELQEVEPAVKMLKKAQHPELRAKFLMIRRVLMMNDIMVRSHILIQMTHTYINITLSRDYTLSSINVFF